MSTNILPFRRPDLDGPPDTLMRVVDALAGVSDDDAAACWDAAGASNVSDIEDHWTWLLPPCPEHDRACGPWCEALWGYPEEQARLAQERRYADGHRASDLRVCTNPGCKRCGLREAAT